jgi:hypothetical protein
MRKPGIQEKGKIGIIGNRIYEMMHRAQESKSKYLSQIMAQFWKIIVGQGFSLA